MRGFTLVEILVTMMVASILLTAVYGVFLGSLSAKKHCEDASRSLRLCQAILFLAERDLNGALRIPGAEQSFLGESDQSQAGSADRMDFVTTSDARRVFEGRGSDHCEVGYRAVPDPERPGLLRLFRREAGGLSGSPFQGGTLEPLAEGVQSFRLEYLGPDGLWVTEWAQSGLPAAVRLSLVLAPDPGGGMRAAMTATAVVPGGAGR